MGAAPSYQQRLFILQLGLDRMISFSSPVRYFEPTKAICLPSGGVGRGSTLTFLLPVPNRSISRSEYGSFRCRFFQIADVRRLWSTQAFAHQLLKPSPSAPPSPAKMCTETLQHDIRDAALFCPPAILPPSLISRLGIVPPPERQTPYLSSYIAFQSSSSTPMKRSEANLA